MQPTAPTAQRQLWVRSFQPPMTLIPRLSTTTRGHCMIAHVLPFYDLQKACHRSQGICHPAK